MCQYDTLQRSLPSAICTTPMLTNNPSLRNKNLSARIKVAQVDIFSRCCEAWAAMRCNCDFWKPRMQNTRNIFCLLEKRAKPRNNFITTIFVKSLFITQYRMCYAIYIPLNAKDLAIELRMVVHGNRQYAIKFARANNSDWLRALKHLIKTRLQQMKRYINKTRERITSTKSLTYPRNYRFYRNGNFCKVTYVGRIIAGAKVDARATQ